MNINIQSLHFTHGDELNEFITEKVNRLSHLYERVESANVCLKLDKSDKTENKVCEIRLAVPGNDLFAERRDTTFEGAVNEVVAALRKQLEKKKTQLNPGKSL